MSYHVLNFEMLSMLKIGIRIMVFKDILYKAFLFTEILVYVPNAIPVDVLSAPVFFLA